MAAVATTDVCRDQAQADDVLAVQDVLDADQCRYVVGRQSPAGDTAEKLRLHLGKHGPCRPPRSTQA
jgi:hypothetical protein